ncbi:MAG: dihydrolipoyl dehydrogenase [Hydrogenophilus sp.]|nr:dihydrolipoyl dehydrogenase [Hydrogenophilus sp.]
MEKKVDVAIVGAGSAGLTALKAVRQAGLRGVVIDRGPLGTTCARVGCMPSKSALYVAELWQAARAAAEVGFPSPGREARGDQAAAWAAVREKRDFFAGRTTERARRFAGEDLILGTARLSGPSRVTVQLAEGETLEIAAKAVVAAVGSRPVVPASLSGLPPERVLTTDSLFELEALPERIAVVGLGAVGLEMGLALARLGVRVVGVEATMTIGGLQDEVVRDRAVQRLGREFALRLGAEAQFSIKEGKILVRVAAGEEYEVDAVLVAVGRRSNLDQLGVTAVGVTLDGRGNPLGIDPETLQVGDLPLFVAGDAHGLWPVLHEAIADGATAGENAAQWAKLGVSALLTRRPKWVPLRIVFTNPDLVMVGERFKSLDPERVVVGSASGENNGRSRVVGETEGVIRVYAERGSGRLLGAEMMAPHGESMGHLLAYAIGRGEQVKGLLQMPFYHPVFEELLQSALEDAARQGRW